MEVKIVLGCTFGDEGKGVTTQWLCKKALDEGKKPLVIRFSGGPQAAHTINHNGIEHICSSFGSGVLLGVPTMLLDNTFVDPISLVFEYEQLVEKGLKPEIAMTYFSRIITPHDVMAGRENSKVINDGTCGMGIYATYARYRSSTTLHYTSLVLWEPEGPRTILDQAIKYHNLESVYYEDTFLEACEKLKNIVKLRDSNISEGYDVLIFEGSQGLLLDMDCGFYPNVTPSRVGLNGIEPNYLKNAEVYLVTRTYTTRHGNGYTPKYKLNIDSNKHETNINNEFQGKFKVGALETSIINRAFERHRLDNYAAKYGCKFNLVVTHMDTVLEAGVFKWEKNNCINAYVGNLDVKVVLEKISSAIDLKLQNIYYNDSIESNVKQI